MTDVERRVRTLEKALLPFAKEAKAWSQTVKDRYRPGIVEPGQKIAHAKAEFSIGDLRRAEKLLQGQG